MKVIILSAATGGGHMTTSNVIKTYLNNLGSTATVIDTLKYLSPILDKTVSDGYKHLVSKFPKIYKIMYNQSNNVTNNKLIRMINGIIGKKLLNLLDDLKPNIVISTHPFSTQMMSVLKGKNNIKMPLVCLMTDYAPHMTWINDNVNAYIVSNADMVGSMINMGVNKNIIYPIGIPVDKDFYENYDSKSSLQRLGFTKDYPIILIMGGSMGAKNIINIYKNILKIDMKLQVIIITGKNRKIYHEIVDIVNSTETKFNKIKGEVSQYISDIRNSDYKNLKLSIQNIRKNKIGENEQYIKSSTRVIFYTNEVESYMHLADLIITKPGGLTITEALACNLPMAVFDAIPGQEEENAHFLINNNMAVKLENGEFGRQTIENLLKNSEKLKSMKYSCENFDKSQSLPNLYKILEELVNSEKINK